MAIKLYPRGETLTSRQARAFPKFFARSWSILSYRSFCGDADEGPSTEAYYPVLYERDLVPNLNNTLERTLHHALEYTLAATEYRDPLAYDGDYQRDPVYFRAGLPLCSTALMYDLGTKGRKAFPHLDMAYPGNSGTVRDWMSLSTRVGVTLRQGKGHRNARGVYGYLDILSHNLAPYHPFEIFFQGILDKVGEISLGLSQEWEIFWLFTDFNERVVWVLRGKVETASVEVSSASDVPDNNNYLEGLFGKDIGRDDIEVFRCDMRGGDEVGRFDIHFSEDFVRENAYPISYELPTPEEMRSPQIEDFDLKFMDFDI